MNKYKVIALFGKAGAGKDYILHRVMETDWGKEKLNLIISHTTRPPREGEQDGINYHFLSTPNQFLAGDRLMKWIEFTVFKNWWYGTSEDSLSLDKINIGAFNLQGIEQILNNDKIQCLPVYIKTISKIRLLRQLNREANPDCDEIIRRYLTDEKDFSKLYEKKFGYFVIENNTDEFLSIQNELYYLIENYKWS